jgi:hypothetical protein
MDWGMPLYWWLSSQLQGPTLLRKFPHLEVFTLVIRTSKTTQEDQDIAAVETAKEYTARVIEIERGRYPEWRMPRIRFDWMKDQIWNVYSMAESLLPENQNETGLLYS